jgi:hypothetical protein
LADTEPDKAPPATVKLPAFISVQPDPVHSHPKKFMEPELVVSTRLSPFSLSTLVLVTDAFPDTE